MTAIRTAPVPAHRRILAHALAVAVAITVCVALPARRAEAATTIPFTVDCTSIGYGFDWFDYDDTVAVTMTNCDGGYFFYVFDEDYNVIDFGSAGGTVNVSPGHSLMLGVEGPTYEFFFKPVYPESVPAGTRQITGSMTLPADAQFMSVGGENTPDGDHALGGVDDCGVLRDSDRPYVTKTIRILKAGTYTFRGVATDPVSSYLAVDGSDNPIGDPFFALYSDFDPDLPDDNIVGCNDDLNNLFGYDNSEMAERLSDSSLMEGHLPYFSTSLKAGVYTLVLTLWEGVDPEEWALDYGPASVDFEMWGPADSICEVEDPDCEEPPPSDGFDCVATPFFQVNNGRLFGKSSPAAAGSLIRRSSANFNALAHNPSDGALYARRNGQMIRITPDGITNLGGVTNLPSATYISADIDPDTGLYYVGRPGSGLYAVDLGTMTATPVTLPRTFGALGRDLVIRDGWVWTLDLSGRLKGLNLTTSAVKRYSTGVTGGAGAMWLSGPNQITVWRNTTGEYVRFSGVGGPGVTVGPAGTAAPVLTTDGATCRTALA